MHGGVPAAVMALYVAGLLGPCFSQCFALRGRPASHSCCPRPATTQGPRLDRSATDCCSVTNHLRSTSLETRPASASPFTIISAPFVASAAALIRTAPPPATTSPPLRI